MKFRSLNFGKFLKTFIPFGLVLVVIFGTIYVAVQQNFRQSANDPQIQMAEDQAKILEAGQKPDAINALPKIDLSNSLSTFYIVYDSQGTPIASSAILNGRLPVPPIGSLEAANNQGENRITWQPSTDVRIAAVIVPFHGQNPGYVLAGRSLKETEKRIDMLTKYVAAGFILSLVLVFGWMILKKD